MAAPGDEVEAGGEGIEGEPEVLNARAFAAAGASSFAVVARTRDQRRGLQPPGLCWAFRERTWVLGS